MNVSLLKKVIPFVLLAALVLALVCYPHTAKAETTQPVVLSVWNVDTFEGGRGSRTSFLKRVARQAERRQEGTYYHIVSYTLSGVYESFSRGETPDILSFGVGVGQVDAVPLGRTFAGSDLAVPWCRGAYYLFSLADDLPGSGTPSGSVVLSSGGENLVEASAYFAGIEGEMEESLTAYLDFLGGKYDYLLGTQRDVCRFSSRGVTVYSKLLPSYCDLYQYVSILSREYADACLEFVALLLSEDVQATLSEIGMYPAQDAQGRTVGAFLTPQDLSERVERLHTGTAERELDMLFPAVSQP